MLPEAASSQVPSLWELGGKAGHEEREDEAPAPDVPALDAKMEMKEEPKEEKDEGAGVNDFWKAPAKQLVRARRWWAGRLWWLAAKCFKWKLVVLLQAMQVVLAPS